MYKLHSQDNKERALEESGKEYHRQREEQSQSL